jgi:hypothetical protein
MLSAAEVQVQTKLKEQWRSNQVSSGTSGRRISTATDEGTPSQGAGPGRAGSHAPFTTSSRKTAQKSPSFSAGFFARFFSLRWLVVAAAVPTRASQPLVLGAMLVHPRKTLSRTKKQPLRRKQRGDHYFARIFLFARLPVVAEARAACPASGFLGLGFQVPGLRVLQCAGIWEPCHPGYLSLCPAF